MRVIPVTQVKANIIQSVDAVRDLAPTPFALQPGTTSQMKSAPS
jgi:hypothetical protein